MNRKKIICLLLLFLPFFSGPSSAYDLEKIAKEHLPNIFTYTDIPENMELKTLRGEIPYHMGQLSVMLSKSGKFAYGYVIKAELPMVGSDFLKPYFRQNLSVNEWRGLVRLNRLVMDENSPLRKGAEEIMRGWAAGILGNAAYEVKINLYEIEPYHRLSSDESYLYVAGSKIIYDVGGLEFPFYTRMYFFRNNGHIDLIMLITPDEGKNPLLYALDDLSKAAAKEAYATIMKGQDLSVLLAKDQV